MCAMGARACRSEVAGPCSTSGRAHAGTHNPGGSHCGRGLPPPLLRPCPGHARQAAREGAPGQPRHWRPQLDATSSGSSSLNGSQGAPTMGPTPLAAPAWHPLGAPFVFDVSPGGTEERGWGGGRERPHERARVGARWLCMWHWDEAWWTSDGWGGGGSCPPCAYVRCVAGVGSSSEAWRGLGHMHGSRSPPPNPGKTGSCGGFACKPP